MSEGHDTTNAPPQPPTLPSRRRGRRPVLLALLLAALIGLLYTRPDLRRPAAAAAEQAAASVRCALIAATGLSPRELYAWRLRVAGLYDRPLGRAWRGAVDNARPIALGARRLTALDFAADQITARVYETRLDHGMALRWRLARSAADSDRLYAELQRADATDPSNWRTVMALTSDGRPHEYDVAERGRYRLVFQPELGATVQAELATAVGGSLPFPVVGGHLYDIGGGFGAPRAGGRRKHKGVDIFADRDTPVRAVVAGRVSTGNGGLGGHYIFLSAGLTGPRYYYAHLDHFAVASGARVDQGDVIGYVGNSGNAAGGPTHLHFGIYTAGGAIDPAPFIQPMPSLPTR